MKTKLVSAIGLTADLYARYPSQRPEEPRPTEDFSLFCSEDHFEEGKMHWGNAASCIHVRSGAVVLLKNLRIRRGFPLGLEFPLESVCKGRTL